MLRATLLAALLSAVAGIRLESMMRLRGGAKEKVDGKNLTDIINTEHENVKYLPGIKFTDNVIADPDLSHAVQGATLLIFVLPHQFLGRICPQMTGMAKGCRAVSLIKGIEFENGGPVLISNLIK